MMETVCARLTSYKSAVGLFSKAVERESSCVQPRAPDYSQFKDRKKSLTGRGMDFVEVGILN
jgi:hypothetical protein